jgi:uncharacterized protein YggE
MRSRGSRVFFITIGVLIAIAASSLTALAVELAGLAGNSTRTVSAAGPNPDPNTITVVGEGREPATPDQASLNLGVSVTRSNVRQAISASATEMNKLIDALKGQGVQDADMQTTVVSVNAVTASYCSTCITGYSATNSLSVTIHHLVNVGSVIASAVDAVGNELQLNGVNVTLSNDSGQLKAARALAMQSAGARAEEWAALAKRHVGKILSVSELVGTQAPQFQCNGGCGGGGGVPIQAGQTTVDVTVTVVYQLND